MGGTGGWFDMSSTAILPAFPARTWSRIDWCMSGCHFENLRKGTSFGGRVGGGGQRERRWNADEAVDATAPTPRTKRN